MEGISEMMKFITKATFIVEIALQIFIDLQKYTKSSWGRCTDHFPIGIWSTVAILLTYEVGCRKLRSKPKFLSWVIKLYSAKG